VDLPSAHPEHSQARHKLVFTSLIHLEGILFWCQEGVERFVTRYVCVGDKVSIIDTLHELVTKLFHHERVGINHCSSTSNDLSFEYTHTPAWKHTHMGDSPFNTWLKLRWFRFLGVKSPRPLEIYERIAKSSAFKIQLKMKMFRPVIELWECKKALKEQPYRQDSHRCGAVRHDAGRAWRLDL